MSRSGLARKTLVACPRDWLVCSRLPNGGTAVPAASAYLCFTCSIRGLDNLWLGRDLASSANEELTCDHNTSGDSAADVDRCRADLAAQPKLGLRPERHAGVVAGDPATARADRSHLGLSSPFQPTPTVEPWTVHSKSEKRACDPVVRKEMTPSSYSESPSAITWVGA
jgi:hypothetical protein